MLDKQLPARFFENDTGRISVRDWLLELSSKDPRPSVTISAPLNLAGSKTCYFIYTNSRIASVARFLTDKKQSRY